jgi:hypothetical protein
VTDQSNATTIELDYAEYPVVREQSPTTTMPEAYHFEFGQEVRNRQADQPTRASSASVLAAYLEQVITGPSAATIRSPNDEFVKRPGRGRNAALIALLEKWLADDSGYDEKTWPALKKRIEESRLSTRKRFSE